MTHTQHRTDKTTVSLSTKQFKSTENISKAQTFSSQITPFGNKQEAYMFLASQ